MVPCEKPKMVSFAYSIMKYIAGIPAKSRFSVKLICCISLGSTSSTNHQLLPLFFKSLF